MNASRLMASLFSIALFTGAISAADLAKIDRTLAKQPIYKSNPRYCLLVFGPEAKTRVWLVLDGDILYVDRNADGDLSGEGKRVLAKKADIANAEKGDLSFEVGDIRDGKLTHKNLTVSLGNLSPLVDSDQEIKEYVAKNPQARGCILTIDIEMAHGRGAGSGQRVGHCTFLRDVQGFLKFADTPQGAPVIHFGGPLQVTLFARQQLTVGRETDIVLGVGTPGLGAGTTAFIAYEDLIPGQVYPQLEITYPPHDGEKPIRKRYELKERC